MKIIIDVEINKEANEKGFTKARYNDILVEYIKDCVGEFIERSHYTTDYFKSYEVATGDVMKLPPEKGYIVHDGHVDEVSLISIDVSGVEVIFTYDGYCEDDGFPFEIDIEESKIDEVLFKTWKEAESIRLRKVYGLGG